MRRKLFPVIILALLLVLNGCGAGGASGISAGFPGLSRCGGQVAHVLLTRSPLYSPPGGLSRSTCMC